MLQSGVAVFGVGLALLAAALGTSGAAVSIRTLLLPLAVSGLGMGLVIAPLVDVILAGVRGRDAGAASGVLNAVGQLGQATGVAALGALFFVSLAGTSAADYADALRLTLKSEIVLLAACIGVMSLLPKRTASNGTAAEDAADAISAQPDRESIRGGRAA